MSSEVEQSKSFFAASETNGRENNEDSFIVLHLIPAGSQQTLTCLAIADGMGGHEHGEFASSEALRRFARSLFEQLCLEPALNQMNEGSAASMELLESAMRQAVIDTNAHVRRIIEANDWGQAGCTLVAALMSGDEAVVFNLGDSPLFCYNAIEAELHRVTTDHNEAGVLLRAGLISKEMARVHEGRSRLVYFIGIEELPDELPVQKISLEPGDRLLLCSDGISGELLEEHLQERIGQAGVPLINIATQLMNDARALGETDNQTLIIWQHPEPVGSVAVVAETLVALA